jgi:hypothetical protein
MGNFKIKARRSTIADPNVPVGGFARISRFYKSWKFTAGIGFPITWVAVNRANQIAILLAHPA